MAYARQTAAFSYETLIRANDRVLGRFQTSAQTQRDTIVSQKVAAWAIRVSPAGWAAVRDGRLTYSNRAFDLLDRGSVMEPRWRRLAAEGGAADGEDESGRTLRGVALDEASLLLDDASVPRRQGRFVRGPQIVELAVERPTSSDDPGAVLVLVRDVTELVKAEVRVSMMQARMMEAERAEMAAELAAGVAHDLGNLVGALRARLVGLPHEPAYRLVTTAMETIIDSQAALVNRLQSVIHPRSAAPVTLDIFRDVIEPAVQVVGSSLRRDDQEQGGRIEISITPAVCEEISIVAPRDEVINMIINLFLNARDAMPGGGTISVDVDRLFGGVRLRIEDEGTGIAPAHLQRIFEPLFSTKGQNGLGMGLATASALMRRLGGSISARNRAEGGACFELTFVDVVQASAP